MSLLRRAADAGERLTDGAAWARTGFTTRAVVVAAMGVGVGASFGAGGAPPWIVPLLLVAGAVLTAARPDTHIALAVLLVFGWYWLVHVDRATSPWTLVAAAALLVFHLATSAAAVGPPASTLPPQVLRGWTVGAARIVAGTVGLWLLTVGFRHLDAGVTVLLTAVALAVVAAGGWLAFSRSRPSRS